MVHNLTITFIFKPDEKYIHKDKLKNTYVKYSTLFLRRCVKKHFPENYFFTMNCLTFRKHILN